MSDEIVFDVLCTKVLDALRALGLGKFSIRNYYYANVANHKGVPFPRG